MKAIHTFLFADLAGFTSDYELVDWPAVRSIAYQCVCKIEAMARDPDTCDLLCLDLPKAEWIRQQLPSPEDLGLWAAGAKALGDPTRLAVALALRDGESACVCDLSWIVGRDERLVSHHARALKATGLARSQRDGKMVMYELTERGRALLAAVAERGTVA